MDKRIPTTQDQNLYKTNGQLKADIDVYITREWSDTPSINECRHAVLTIKTSGQRGFGYVVYDRLLCRVVNGVFFGDDPEAALGVAQYYNEFPGAWQNMAPNGTALNLQYPEIDKSKIAPILVENREVE